MTNRRRLRSLAAVPCTALLLVACSAGTHPSSGAATKSITLTTLTPAATSTVAKVTWNVFEGEPNTLDPFESASYTPNMINSNLCETLLAQRPDLSIGTNLATSYSNPDPLHWVYDLRSDVTFWDGTPMTAEDVAFSLQHNMTDHASLYSYLFSNVKNIHATGAHQVTVTLSHPDYLFNDELASFAGVVVEKKFYEAHASNFGTPSVGVMCTGPYEFSAWSKGQSITLTKNPHYWNTALEPKVSTLIFTFLTDSSTITAGLLSGQIDGTYLPPYKSLPQLEHSSEGKVYFGPSLLDTTLVYSNPAGALGNLKIREALQMAIDWQGLIKTVFDGAGTQLRSFVPPTAFGDESAALQAAYKTLPEPQSGQVTQAKALVAEAGTAASKSITMVVPSQTEGREIGLAVQSGAQQIGLKFQLITVPEDSYANYLYDPKTRAGDDILVTDFWPNIPNALDYIGLTSVSGAAFNQYGYTGVNSLYATAQSTADPTARAQLVAQLQGQLRGQLLPMAPGINSESTVWLNKRITGAPASFDFVYYPWAAYLGGTG